ncbi:MAG: O-antigen ligase family protein [Crocinitomicaceae bacterium]|nr:O-antigen ligase family protein [Crocinitomicaceae bacterium]
MINSIKKNIAEIGWMIFVFTLVACGYYTSPAIGVLIVSIGLDWILNKNFKFVFSQINFLFILLFIFYALSLLWSENPETGGKLLEYKMSFFVFPILLFFQKSTLNFRFLIVGFLFGSIVLMLELLVPYWMGYEQSLYETSRRWANLHPTYAATYLCIAGIICVLIAARVNTSWQKWLAVVGFFSICFVIYMIGSFAATLFTGIMILALVAYLFSLRTNRWIAILILVVCIPVSALIFYNSKKFSYDIEVLNETYRELKMGKAEFMRINQLSDAGTKHRLLLWMVSFEIIAENPILGVGLGDMDDEISEKCEEHQLEVLQKSQMNPHNQFLQIGIDLGLSGLVYFLLLIFLIGRHAIANTNHLLLLLLSCLIFNSFFESVLQRQQGIVFFTSLISLLIVYSENWKSNLNLKLIFARK